MILGVFDTLLEVWVALAMIIQRFYASRPNVRHRALTVAILTQSIGTLAETPFVLWLFFAPPMRQKWELSFMIATPLAHVLFLFSKCWTVKTLAEMAVMARREEKVASRLADDVESFPRHGSAASDNSSATCVTKAR